jgi:asparagine synthase (glutamine-hydrolysing)
MCGIFGLISKSEGYSDQFQSELLKETIQHRGPSGSGVHHFKNGFAGNVRLAIVDRAGGHQPIYTGDEKFGIVYNGEVYNHNELRDQLTNLGHSFHTKSDTEVVLQSYVAYGVAAFDKLNGMFAFCLWDEAKDIKYLVRDQIGIKPLYVYEDGNVIVFSSEIKSLLSFPNLDLSLNPLGLQDYLLYRYIPGPHTLYKRIRKLEPGTYLEIKSNGSATQWRYWDTSYSESYPPLSLSDAKEQLDDLMTKSVKSQLMGEVPVGVLLSGGLDSSVISYYVKKANANLKTFNIGFPDVNEFAYSRQVAKKFGLEHFEIETTVDELVARYDKVSLAIDEPLSDPACLPLYRLGEELKKHVVVVLSGEGGDELFAGYNQYGEVLGEPLEYNEEYNYFIKRSWYFQDHMDFLNDKTIPPSHLRFRKYFEENPLLNGMLNFDMKTWMPDNLMMKADKILMSHSLEGRFPFLDLNVFNFSCELPENFKLKGKITKFLLRDLVDSVMPKDIIQRPKMGFTVPVDQLNLKMKDLAMTCLQEIVSTEMGALLDVKKIQELFRSYYRKPEGQNHLKIWTLFTLFYWYLTTIPRYTVKIQSLFDRRNVQDSAIHH